MPKERQSALSDREILQLLNILETRGREGWSQRWKEHMAIPEALNVSSDREEEQERVLRYLLLRVLINQQAKFEKVREISISLLGEFGDSLLFKPFDISESKLLSIFRKVAGSKGALLYKVGSLGGIKPVSLFLYRFKAYEGFIRWLDENKLSIRDFILEELKNGEPKELFNTLRGHDILSAGWVGNDPKACRMYVNWILFLLNEILGFRRVKIEKSLMIVDGHVGKVFCRTGLIDEVLYEKQRPYIIQASKMRPKIEETVSKFNFIPFYVDNGAFYLFEEGYCADLDPKCDVCPVGMYCKRYIKWTAYKMHPG